MLLNPLQYGLVCLHTTTTTTKFVFGSFWQCTTYTVHSCILYTQRIYICVCVAGAAATATATVVVDDDDRLLPGNFCFTNMTFCNYNNVISCLLLFVVVVYYCFFISNRLFCFHRLPVSSKRTEHPYHYIDIYTRKGKTRSQFFLKKRTKMTPPHQWQWGTVLLLMGICVIGISAQGTIFLHIRNG